MTHDSSSRVTLPDNGILLIGTNRVLGLVVLSRGRVLSAGRLEPHGPCSGPCTPPPICVVSQPVDWIATHSSTGAYVRVRRLVRVGENTENPGHCHGWLELVVAFTEKVARTTGPHTVSRYVTTLNQTASL